ncbi:MAG TPA: ABC transporter ATP-binding protein [Candidatus Dormibacteraeota bacterium]|nr:ABC transporter ATP-binding protein [Candidatus Dormibacteraeota bacterium]
MTDLLEVRDLTVHFDTEDGLVEAVDGVTFNVRSGEILGVVGESGSGKSVTALALLRLIRPPGRIVQGAVRFEGTDLVGLSEDEMRSVRGRRIAMVFQSPRTALNPVLTVGRQISRLFELHQGASRGEGRARTIGMLKLVGISEPERRARQYAHQLSGGMCQRVMIAMALATSPRLLLADEPTTGLDVSIAAQILELLRDLGRRTGASILLITHDLGVVAEVCDRVAVMHAGQIVEVGAVRTIFARPLHPYTQALVRSIPRLDRDVTMEPIPGMVPSLLAPPPGCRYADRCPRVLDVCRRDRPAPRAAAPNHEVACHAAEVEDAPARG